MNFSAIDSVIYCTFGQHEIPGELLVNYDMIGTDATHSDCIAAEIVGFHLGGNVVLTRDQLVQLESESHVKHLETIYTEEREAV